MPGKAIVTPTTAALFRRVSRTHAALQKSVFRNTLREPKRRSIKFLHPMATAAISHALERLRDRESPNKWPVEVIYTPQPEWPLRSIAKHPKCLRLSILDSSFNPPTLAHAALARLGPPNKTSNSGAVLSPSDSYDAYLLLLSVTNAEKVLKPGDAGLEQRLEMMQLLAKELQASEADHSAGNVAVAAIDEPTFVGKARQLREFLLAKIINTIKRSTVDGERGDSATPVPSLQLHFILGFDTAIRMFSTRFYTSKDVMLSSLKTFFDPMGDNCVIVCARRSLKDGASKEDRDTEEREFLESTEVRGYIEIGRVVLVDIPEDLQAISSTKVRKGEWDLVPPSIRDYIEKEKLYASV
jgi:nicotinamide-nucleotide adenylyltransferase